MTNYYQKYLKYKNKYVDLKKQLGGAEPETDNEPMNLNDYLYVKRKFFGELLNIFTDESRIEFLGHLEKFLNSLSEYPKDDSKFLNLYETDNFEKYIKDCKENENDNYKLKDNIYYLPNTDRQLNYFKNKNQITIILDDDNVEITSLSDISCIYKYTSEFYNFIIENTVNNEEWNYRLKVQEIKEQEINSYNKKVSNYNTKVAQFENDNKPKEKYWGESDQNFEDRKKLYETNLDKFKEDNKPKEYDHFDERKYKIPFTQVKLTEEGSIYDHQNNIKETLDIIKEDFDDFNNNNTDYSKNNFEKIIDLDDNV